MRNKHGPGFKRHIKTDDSSLSLYLDVYVPKTKEWMRVDMDLVLADNKGRREKKAKISSKKLLTTCDSGSEEEQESEMK